MGKVWDEMQSARIEDLTHSIEPTPEREQATYESASITITAGSREDLFTIGRAKYAIYLGKDV